MKTSGPKNIHNRHKISFPEQVREAIRISDIVIELLDARCINDSRIPEIELLVNSLGKKLIQVITKTDLVPNSDLIQNSELKNLNSPILVSALAGEGIKKLRERIIIESKRLKASRRTNITILGYPNTGKSTLINILVRRNAAPISSQPGWTKSIRKIKLNKDIILIDSPGIIQKDESLYDSFKDLKKHSKFGVQIPESVREPDFIVSDLMKEHPQVFERFYAINANGDSEILLEEIARKNNFLKKGGLPDTDRAARFVLKDWQKGRIKSHKTF